MPLALNVYYITVAPAVAAGHAVRIVSCTRCRISYIIYTIYNCIVILFKLQFFINFQFNLIFLLVFFRFFFVLHLKIFQKLKNVYGFLNGVHHNRWPTIPVQVNRLLYIYVRPSVCLTTITFNFKTDQMFIDTIVMDLQKL